MTKTEYENLVELLVGEEIHKVEYFEINYDGYETDFSGSGSFDSLDYGANLHMASGQVFGFIWGDEFFQYGVSVLKTPLQSEVSECRKVEVSNSKNWKLLIGKTITSTLIDWSWVKESGLFKKKVYYPQSIVLNLEGGGLVIISALEIQDGTHFGMADNITVFFDEPNAVKYGALNA
ncbi:hypothetical protein [Marinomonas sp. THO17]|uniref:hypothetical protein n=1 Tax=Marinomonas sp. THO17 TaxID=3149048 RepID=UPI00336C25DA